MNDLSQHERHSAAEILAGGQTLAAEVVIDGGHGGAPSAITLRKTGFSGSILIVGKESELPYKRPPFRPSIFQARRSSRAS